MKYYRKAQSTAKLIIDAFKSGNIARPLAQVFITPAYDMPMRHWSFGNRFACALAGCVDARGFKQWRAVGRHVVKGQHAAANILVPMTTKIEEDDKEHVITYGFTSSPVFDVTQTEGDPMPETTDLISQLPLIEVAKAWDIEVTLFSGEHGQALGQFSWGNGRKNILLGVENLSTWAHELIHAADERMGNLQADKRDPHWMIETIAELGGATLLTILGEETAADYGGTWEYIEAKCKAEEITPITACTRTLERIGSCIDLILQTANGFQPVA